MKKIGMLLLLVSGIMTAQETEFKFTKDGFTDYVIGTVPNKTASELYKKSIDWINITYKNPREVIKAQIENDYIRIEGISSSMLCKKILNWITKQQILALLLSLLHAFKDARRLFEFWLSKWMPISVSKLKMVSLLSALQLKRTIVRLSRSLKKG